MAFIPQPGPVKPPATTEAKKLGDLRSTLFYRVSSGGVHQPYFKDPIETKEVLPITVTGGIGDLIVAIPLIKEIQNCVGRVMVYSSHPQILTQLSGLPTTFDAFPGADLWLHINHLPVFRTYGWKGKFHSDPIKQLFIAWEHRMKEEEWHTLAKYHPLLDNEIGNKAVAKGLNRRTLACHILGLNPPVWRFTPPGPALQCERPFITIHDGFDGAHSFGRSTKNWPVNSWNHFVNLFKLKYPTFDVVQLGGPKSKAIQGTINLTNQISFLDSVRFLKQSQLHIDGESGLVHAAHCVGTKSIVLFGPTSVDYFAYPENVSLTSDACPGNCWWLTKVWMEKCPIGYVTPPCLDRIHPQAVLNAVASVLK